MQLFALTFLTFTIKLDTRLYYDGDKHNIETRVILSPFEKIFHVFTERINDKENNIFRSPS